MRVTDLPPEILMEIRKHLGNKDLGKLRLLNREWSESSYLMHTLFNNVRIPHGEHRARALYPYLKTFNCFYSRKGQEELLDASSDTDSNPFTPRMISHIRCLTISYAPGDALKYDISNYINVIKALPELQEAVLDISTKVADIYEIQILMRSLRQLLFETENQPDVHARFYACGHDLDRALKYLRNLPLQTKSLKINVEGFHRTTSRNLQQGLSLANNLEVLQIDRVSLPEFRDVINDFKVRLDARAQAPWFADCSGEVREGLLVTPFSKLRILEVWEPLLFRSTDIAMEILPALRELDVTIDAADPGDPALYDPEVLEPVWSWLKREQNSSLRLRRVRTNYALWNLVDYLASEAARDIQELEIYFAEKIPTDKLEGVYLFRLGWWTNGLGHRFTTAALPKVCIHLRSLTLLPIEWGRASFAYRHALEEDRDNLDVILWLQWVKEWTPLQNGVSYIFENIRDFSGYMVYNEDDPSEVEDFSRIFKIFPNASELKLHIFYYYIDEDSRDALGNRIFELAETAMNAHLTERQRNSDGRLILRVMSISKDICMDKKKTYYFSQNGLKCYEGAKDNNNFEATWDFTLKEVKQRRLAIY